MSRDYNITLNVSVVIIVSCSTVLFLVSGCVFEALLLVKEIDCLEEVITVAVDVTELEPVFSKLNLGRRLPLDALEGNFLANDSP